MACNASSDSPPRRHQVAQYYDEACRKQWSAKATRGMFGCHVVVSCVSLLLAEQVMPISIVKQLGCTSTLKCSSWRAMRMMQMWRRKEPPLLQPVGELPLPLPPPGKGKCNVSFVWFELLLLCCLSGTPTRAMARSDHGAITAATGSMETRRASILGSKVQLSN